MRLLKFAAILILTGCAGMQPAKQTSIENVIEAPGRNKDQIYSATKNWIAENFVSAKAVIENDDKASGTIIGNARVKYPCSGINCVGREGWMLAFNMRIDIKDQKFKITISNMILSVPPRTYAGFERPLLQDEFDEAQPVLSKLGPDLLESIKKEHTKASW